MEVERKRPDLQEEGAPSRPYTEAVLLLSIFSTGTTDCNERSRALCSDRQELLPSVSPPGARHDLGSRQRRGGVTSDEHLPNTCAELITFCLSTCFLSRGKRI